MSLLRRVSRRPSVRSRERLRGPWRMLNVCGRTDPVETVLAPRKSEKRRWMLAGGVMNRPTTGTGTLRSALPRKKIIVASSKDARMMVTSGWHSAKAGMKNATEENPGRTA